MVLFKLKDIELAPPWLSHISSAQRKELNFDSSRFIQIATIGVDNRPRVRTVVFRGWSESYEMKIFIDKRSQKYHELNLNNNIEICWLFSRSKCQFRFRGTSSIILGKENLSHWEQLSNESKSMWFWPSPGDEFVVDQPIDLSFKTKECISNNFALLKINITHVDQLLLYKPIHRRRCWILKEDWIEKKINP